MDAMVDRLIECLEALARWGHRQTRRGFDACTEALPWADRLVLRRDLAEVGRTMGGVLLILGATGWLAIGYYRRFVAGPHPDTHESLFRLYWWVLACASTLVGGLTLLWGAAVVLIALIGTVNAWCTRPSNVRTPQALARQRWTSHRDRTIDRWRANNLAGMVADEQAALRHAWAQGEADAAQAQQEAGGGDEPTAPRPEAPVRRRL